MSIITSEIQKLANELIYPNPELIQTWKAHPITDLLFKLLTIRRLELLELSGKQPTVSNDDIADRNRAVGLLEAIDDILEMDVFDYAKELTKEEDKDGTTV